MSKKVKSKKAIAKKVVVTIKKDSEGTLTLEQQTDFVKEPIIPIVESPIIPETVSAPQQVETLSSSSMLDDLMTSTDKDNESSNETDEIEFEDQTENTSEETTTNTSSTASEQTATNIGDKIHDTLTTEGEDWQNPTDFKKMCQVNAMMYVEGGAILLSFIGQMISGDWSAEGEKKYTPSEERRKLIRAPLAKKFELNKDRSNKTPTGAMITAIIFTIIPIVIVAFKDRKARVEAEAQNIENLRLKNELNKANEIITSLHQNNPVSHSPSISKPNETLTGFSPKVLGRGRHKKDCGCEKCMLKKMKTKKR